MNLRTRSLAAVLPIAIAGAVPGFASAQGPGVKFDEDSPAGKEYAIPLDEARKVGGAGSTGDASPGNTTSGRASEDAALFGAGIAKAGSTGSARDKSSRSGSGSNSGSKPSSKRPTKRPEATPAKRDSEVERALAASGSRQRSAGLLIGGAALGLVALVTVLLRLRRRPQP